MVDNNVIYRWKFNTEIKRITIGNYYSLTEKHPLIDKLLREGARVVEWILLIINNIKLII